MAAIEIRRVDQDTLNGYRQEFVLKALREPREYVTYVPSRTSIARHPTNKK